MKRKVIYSGFDIQIQGLIDHLYAKHNWTPVFFSAVEQTRPWANVNYPDAVMHNEMAMRQSKFDYSRIGPPIPVDAKIIATLSKYESNCLLSMEDTTGWNFSFEERVRYYYDLLTYWNTVINRLKPDLLVAFNWPHTNTAYTLYLMCKHGYGMDVLFLDPMRLMGRNLHVIGTVLEDLSRPFKETYASGEQLDLGPYVKEYLTQVRGKKWQITLSNKADEIRFSRLKHFRFKEFVYLLFLMAQGKAFDECPMAFKKNKQPFDSPRSKLSYFDHFWFRNHLRRNDVQLEKIYVSFCEPTDLKQKYLYFAAAQQPEATSEIGAGVYTDHMLVMSLLSASIPKDWVIYYREHPGSFWPLLKGSLRRSRYFYEKIKSFKNVRIIFHKVDPYKLMDGAQAVASVTGTSSFEAVVRGKPGLFFGNVWYQGCKSVFKINTFEDCQDAIRQIVNGYIPDQTDVERYLAAVEKVAIKGYTHMNFNAQTRQLIAEALYEADEKYYPKHLNQPVQSFS